MLDQIQVSLFNAFARLKDDERGQTLVEYSLIAALIAIGAIGALTAFQLSMGGLYDKISAVSDAMVDALS